VKTISGWREHKSEKNLELGEHKSGKESLMLEGAQKWEKYHMNIKNIPGWRQHKSEKSLMLVEHKSRKENLMLEGAQTTRNGQPLPGAKRRDFFFLLLFSKQSRRNQFST
jgi:hypothetical protein